MTGCSHVCIGRTSSWLGTEPDLGKGIENENLVRWWVRALFGLLTRLLCVYTHMPFHGYCAPKNYPPSRRGLSYRSVCSLANPALHPPILIFFFFGHVSGSCGCHRRSDDDDDYAACNSMENKSNCRPVDQQVVVGGEARRARKRVVMVLVIPLFG